MSEQDPIAALLDRMIADAEYERKLAKGCLKRFGDKAGLSTRVLELTIQTEALRKYRDTDGLNSPMLETPD